MLVAAHIVTALQSIVSRNVPALDSAVVSATTIQGGDAYNVIPQSAVIRVLMQFHSDRSLAEVDHVYLDGAEALRDDLE